MNYIIIYIGVIFCITLCLFILYINFLYKPNLCVNDKCLTKDDINNIKSLSQQSTQQSLCIDNQCLTKQDLNKLKSSNIVVVNRRPIVGVGKLILTSPVRGTQINPTKLFDKITYGPFRYGIPPPANGATRKFRLYAVYSDTSQISPGPVFRIEFMSSSNWSLVDTIIDFQFPNTWGATEGETRDAYSNMVDEPSQHMHGHLYSYSHNDSSVLWTYVEIQALDVFDI